MSGFIRRYGSFPGVETITLIEGVIIADIAPPGSINGVASGVVALVGEFADMTYATQVSASGVVTTFAQPVELFSSQDMMNKVGGWDETIGQHGGAGGNGFVALRNKQFARLVAVPVNLCSGGAGRAWRDLPTNAGAASAIPVVALLGGSASAGREFRSSSNRVRLGKKAVFTALGHYKNGVDGAMTSAGAAVTQSFTSAGGAFLTAYNSGPVPKGAIVVIGQIGGAGALGSNAGTYRVQTIAVSNTALVLEKLDGTSFDWVTGTSAPYRIHPQTDADTGGTNGINAALADTSGYTLPCRPLDATIAAATTCTPTVVPTAGAAGSWDSLSGLALRSHVSAGFVYAAATQAVNAANDATIDALYATATDALLNDASPSRDVNVLCMARTSATINAKQKSHVLISSQNGVGRMTVISPPLTTVSLATVTGDSTPGVGTNRDERVMYSWPGAVTFVPEAVGFTCTTADGLTVTDGNLDTRGDLWLAAVLSNLAPERNPGQSAPPVNTIMAPILGLQRSCPSLGVQEYISLRAAGVVGLRLDRKAGPIFQSGITTSLTTGLKNINRRRMADFIQDSVAQSIEPLSKLPLTQGLKDTITGEIDAFLNQLKSPSNPSAQRIVDYQVDDKSGNTPDLEARGIFVVIGRVQTLATADFIVFQTEIGEGVKITTT